MRILMDTSYKCIHYAAHACGYLWIPRENAYIMLPMHADTCGYLVKMHTICIYFLRKCCHPASQRLPASPASPVSQPSQPHTATQSPAHLPIILDRFAGVFSTFSPCFESVVNSDVLAPPIKHEKTLYFLSISALNSWKMWLVEGGPYAHSDKKTHPWKFVCMARNHRK